MRRINGTGRSAGFSLVELMLALALGVVVVTGIVQLFVGNSRTYEVLNGQARMQENARFALEFISRAARSAGFFGCSLERDGYVNGLGGEWENIPDREWDITQPIQAGADWVQFRGMRGNGRLGRRHLGAAGGRRRNGVWKWLRPVSPRRDCAPCGNGSNRT